LHERIRIQLHGGGGDRDAVDHGTKTVVVWGLEGAGLQRHRNEYKATFWIEAGGKESIERDFMHIYPEVHTLYRAMNRNPPRTHHGFHLPSGLDLSPTVANGDWGNNA
jgi:hypothetical protein